MGILQRAKDILSANINDLLDRCENPEKMINQYLLQYRKDLKETKDDTAEIMANEAQAKRQYEDCLATVQRFMNAAENAVKAGNDDDARKLLVSKQRHEARLPELKSRYETAKADSQNMRAVYNKLCDDIKELEFRKSSIQSTVAMARGQERINNIGRNAVKMGGMNDKFDQMQDKANRMLDKAKASALLDSDVTSSEDLAEKYASAPSEVEDELAALKAKVNGIS